MKPIEIRYEDLFEILWKAKYSYKLDYEKYGEENDLKRVNKLEEIIREINESPSMDLVIMEAPF